MKDFLKELFEYSHDSNQKYIHNFESHPDKSSEKAIKLMSHILCAHHIWNARLEKHTPQYAVWQLHPIDLFREIETINFQKSLYLLETIDLTAIADYKTSTGVEMRSSVRDMLFHVVNHSTYHRAQIAMEWKQNGLEPGLTDYIFYKR